MKSIFIQLLFSLGIIFLCLGCNTRKKSIEKERLVTVTDTLYKRDSIFITRDKVLLLPTVNTAVIPNPCDSMGKLKVVEKVIRIPYGKVEIKSEGNNLIAKVNTDSIASVIEKQYRERDKKHLHEIAELEKEKKQLKVTPFNWWQLGGTISLLVNVFFILCYVNKKFTV